jgi:SH3-like domain-containing protein
MWKVEQYFPLRIVNKSGDWYQFEDFEGDRGWIHKSLVSKIPAVITKNDTCNIRSGPGTSHGILFTVEKGIPFKVLKREGSWIHIEHSDGDQGWIHKALVW